MKPDWKDAPEWAQWLAMDSDGYWYWYSHEPYVITEGWVNDISNIAYAGCSKPWHLSLTGRPKTHTPAQPASEVQPGA